MAACTKHSGGGSSNVRINNNGERTMSPLEVMQQLADDTQRQSTLFSSHDIDAPERREPSHLDDSLGKKVSHNSLESLNFSGTKSKSSSARWESLLAAEIALSRLSHLPSDNPLQDKDGNLGSLDGNNLNLNGYSLKSSESQTTVGSWQRTLLADSMPTPCTSSIENMMAITTPDATELSTILGPTVSMNDDTSQAMSIVKEDFAFVDACASADRGLPNDCSNPFVTNVIHNFSLLAPAPTDHAITRATVRSPESPVSHADAIMLLHLSANSGTIPTLQKSESHRNKLPTMDASCEVSPTPSAMSMNGENETDSKGDDPSTLTTSNTPKRKRKKNVDDEALREYITDGFTKTDVLLGRGGLANNHIGNKTYLEFKRTLQARYMAVSKYEKTAISEELVQWVRNHGGRFLDRDAKTGRWYQVSLLKARKKASQTLRENYTPDTLAEKRAKYSRPRRERQQTPIHVT